MNCVLRNRGSARHAPLQSACAEDCLPANPHSSETGLVFAFVRGNCPYACGPGLVSLIPQQLICLFYGRSAYRLKLVAERSQKGDALSVQFGAMSGEKYLRSPGLEQFPGA